MKSIIIGTRGSQLALAQAEYIRQKLLETNPKTDISLKIIKTMGDKFLQSPLSRIGGKGVFVKEIEEALQRGDIDLAVHSLKDVPTELPSGLELSVICKREDPSDAFVSSKYKTIQALPKGSTVGTSSLRRKVQLLHLNPDLKVVDLRGNVDTRLKKLDRGEYDAIVMSAAALKRLGLEKQISQVLNFIPAVGQGALVLETRKKDKDLKDKISFLNDKKTAQATFLERLFLKEMQGGCQVPLGAYATCNEMSFLMSAFIGSLDGKLFLEHNVKGLLVDSQKNVLSLSQELLNRGGKKILETIERAGKNT